MNRPDRFMGAAPTSIPVLLLGQVRLEDRLQHQNCRHLDHAIFYARHPKRPLLVGSGFGYPNPPHGLGPIAFALQFLSQFFQPTIHSPLLNLLETHPVHPRCATVGTAAPPGVQEHVLPIQLVVESVKPAGWFALRFSLQRFLKLPDTFWSY